MFNTPLPLGMWKPGDTFLAAYDLRQFRIVEIGELENPDLEHATKSGSSSRSGDLRREDSVSDSGLLSRPSSASRSS